MKIFTRYFLTPVYAILLSIALYLIMSHFFAQDGTLLHYWYEMISQRGPTSYLIVFLTFFTLSMTLFAMLRKDYRTPLILGLYGFSAMPIIVGAIGTIAGISFSLLGLAAMVPNTAGPFDYKEISNFITQHYNNIAVGADTLLLGLYSTLASWTAIVSHCLSSKEAPH